MLTRNAVFVNGSTRSVAPVIYLARHATPDWNRSDIRYDIAPGPDLVPQGEVEAARLGEFLRNVGATHIIASPLVRTHRTAEIAGAIAGIPVTTDDAIREYSREENDQIVYERILPQIEVMFEKAARSGPIAIVTHGGPVRVMLERLGANRDELWHYRRQFDHQNPLPPAAAWELTRSDATQPWQMRFAFSPTPFEEYLPAVHYA
ncbi:MAG: histidine phosphatase family protein [Caldilinea sp.]